MNPAERARAFLEALEERAGILEYEAGFSRAEAEKLAGPMTLASFRDRDQAEGESHETVS